MEDPGPIFALCGEANRFVTSHARCSPVLKTFFDRGTDYVGVVLREVEVRELGRRLVG